MEEQNVQASAPEAAAKQRPTFLTILCILTFIGSGLAVLMYLLGIFGIGALNNLLGSYAGATADAGVLKPILMLVISAASLYGAVMMWNLKKLGFYLYVAAQVLLLVFGWGILALVFAVLFVVLYGLNLKHLQ